MECVNHTCFPASPLSTYFSPPKGSSFDGYQPMNMDCDRGIGRRASAHTVGDYKPRKNDADAIRKAVNGPSRWFVPSKYTDQQDLQVLYRTRGHLRDSRAHLGLAWPSTAPFLPLHRSQGREELPIKFVSESVYNRAELGRRGVTKRAEPGEFCPGLTRTTDRRERPR
jgi:hypothetical protein